MHCCVQGLPPARVMPAAERSVGLTASIWSASSKTRIFMRFSGMKSRASQFLSFPCVAMTICA